MFAIYDDNPYPPNSISYKIWERNEKIGSGKIKNAKKYEKFAIYLYVMGTRISDISKTIGISTTSVDLLLKKYYIKLDS